MAIREGCWDCDSCDSKGIRGSVRVCPDCGDPRGEDVESYLPENAPAVTDEAQLREAESGADWNCEHCSAGNSNLNTACTQCGATKGTSPINQTHDYSMSEIPRSGRKSKTPVYTAAQSFSSSPDTDSRVRSSTGQHILMGSGVVALVLLLVALVWPRERELVVTKALWKRSVSIEIYKTVRETDWNVPPTGKTLASETRIRDYVRVLDHYETKTRSVSYQVQTGTDTYVCGATDMGNGHFRDRTCSRPTYETKYRDESYQDPVYRRDPVYGTWYTYDIDKWVPSREPKTSDSTNAPEWPNFTLASNEREQKRSGVYSLRLRDPKKNKEHMYTCDEKEWRSYSLNEHVKGKISLGILSSVKKIILEK